MKNYVPAVILTCLLISLSAVAALDLEQSTVTDDYLRIMEADNRGMILKAEFPLPQFELKHEETGEFSALRISGCGVTSETGRPELPAYTKLLRLPASGGIEFEIIPGPSHTYHDIAVYPSQPLQIDGHPVPQFTRDSETYNSDRSYPGELVERGDIAIWRDIRVVPMNFFPVQYNPLTKELRIYESIEVRISYTPEGDNEMAARREFVSSAFKPIYDALSIGVEDLIVDENSQRGSIIIITPSNYLSIVQQLAEWKQRIGYETTVVTTQQTGGSANQIKDYISDAYFGWEPPPEYVILIGDEDSGLPCFWIQGYYYPQNCTDHPFALLEGDDYFPEIFVGRISVDNTTQMTTYLNKINHYEKEPYLTQTNWYNRALMIAHYSGAESCMLTKEFCEDQVIYGGITEVENAYFPGSSYSTISNTINSGALFVNYRGYGGCTYWTTGSGNWGVSSVNSLNNGYKMPVVTGMVCGGGNFGYSNGACLGEAWIREGTPTSSDGGIAFCGPSELDTHTKWNNNLDCGLYWGIFREGINHFGPALLRAKMELWIDYPHNRVGLGTPENSVGFYFYVYNILGDPSLQFWTGQPQPITAFYDDTITLGESDFDIQLTNSSGNPITDAYVCIWKLDEIYEGSAPDDLGHLTLPMVDYTAGTMKLTVTGRNLIPLLEDIYIASNPYSLGISNITIDDDNTGGTSGNGDEMITAAETIDLHVTVKNYGSSITGTNINGFLSAVSDKISIITGSVAVGSLAPGSESTHIFRISAADDLNALNTLGLTLNLTSSQGDFSPTLWIDVSYPELSPLRYIFQPAMLEPGGQAELVDSLLNSGMCGLTNIIGVIVTDDPLITIVSGTASFCDIAVNAEGGNASDPFVIAADNNLVPGYMAQFEIAFTCDEGYSFTTIVPVSIGTVLASDPMGPDEYGYYCYDSGDTGYEQAPVYNWQVISAYQGGSGTQLTLPDYGSEQDCYTTMSLPFTFTYYGEDYTQISVNSNGVVSMGINDNVQFRNKAIPSAMGPPAMIAGFWDDLQMSSYGDGKVWKYYDAANHRFIIEYSQVRNPSNSTETLQIILYDPVYYPTPTGDGEIVLQYNTVHDNDSGDNYSTVGIEDWGHTTGLQYVFSNIYPPSSQTLTSGLAVKFTTVPPSYLSMLSLTPLNPPIIIPASGGMFQFDVSLTNPGSTVLNFDFWTEVILPNSSTYSPLFMRTGLSLAPGGNISRTLSQNIPIRAPAGEYLYIGKIGTYSTQNVLDQSEFDFQKSSTDTAGN